VDAWVALVEKARVRLPNGAAALIAAVVYQLSKSAFDDVDSLWTVRSAYLDAEVVAARALGSLNLLHLYTRLLARVTANPHDMDPTDFEHLIKLLAKLVKFLSVFVKASESI
jgi:hypothetical protein